MNPQAKFLTAIVAITIAIIAGAVIILGKSGTAQKAVLGTADEKILYSNVVNSIGDPNAKVKIVEFADFQCPACAAAHPVVKKILEDNKDKVYFVYRHYPLSFHKNAKPAANAAETAARQGKFFEMADLLYQNQKEWQEASKPEEFFSGYAKQLGLDAEKFTKDLNENYPSIEKDVFDANALGVNATPTFFINGQKIVGVPNLDEWSKIIEATP